MTTVETGFRFLAFSQIALLTLAVATVKSRGQGKVWLVALCCGLAAYFLAPIFFASKITWITLPLLVLANAIPMTLWFTIRVLFDDNARVSYVALLIGGASLLLAVWQYLAPFPAAVAVPIDVGIQLVKLAFAVASILLCLRGREADLVSARRSARYGVALALGLVVALVIVAEIATQWRVPKMVETMAMAGFFLASIGLNLILIRSPVFQVLYPLPIMPPAGMVSDDPLVGLLENVMRKERAYADDDLRIGGLAARLGVGEHVLRRTINGTLGQRNFNRYVNAYRLEEASRRLREEPALPILSIALDVGFRSLSAFNAAFRELHDTTPSDFRAYGTGQSVGADSERSLANTESE